MRYLLSNCTKENLVKHPTQWPGAHCARPLCFGEKDSGVWIDRTKLSRLRRKSRAGATVRERDAEVLYELKLAKLPCWKDLSDDEYRSRIRAMCRDVAEEAETKRAPMKATVLGVKRILRFSPHHRPDHVDKSPAPLVHCYEPNFRRRFIDSYRSFVDAYRQARDALERGIGIFRFPEGGIPPGCRFCADTG